MTDAPTTLRIAIGDYPHTLPLKRGEITSPWLKLDFVEVKPMHKAFKPMVREHAFDASEMALVTVLQAKIYNKGLTLLPAAMLARFQHGTVLHNVERGPLSPADLAGKRIGVRSYTQTTGIWIRGILQNDYGVDFSGVQWVTFEDGHLAEFPDPPGVIRAGADKDITQMLIDGEIDAAIYGAAMPKDPRLQSVIPDPDAAGRDMGRQAPPGAGQPHGGGAGRAGRGQTGGGRRVLPHAGGEQADGRAAGGGRGRSGALWQGRQPAGAGTAHFLCGAAGPADPPPGCG